MIIEVLGLVFSAFALSRVFLRFREGKLSWSMLLLWSVAWLTVIAFLLSPSTFEPVSKVIGIQRPLDLMLVGGVILSYYLTFRIYVFLEELRSDVAEVVREISLRKERKPKKA
ncbi:MAG: DUF2304 family protein [Candidatus Altiarchaeota archaeon]